MKNHSVAVSEREPAKHQCGCGCGPEKSTCCRLECLERPRFFCGQLLTDSDLSGLVDWTRDRLRLLRYRDGWGVVCGLQVHCDPKRHGWITVGSGYAITCCGDDVIVCEDMPVDLRRYCNESDDPCGDLRRRLDKHEPREEGDATPYAHVRPNELHAVDLFLKYREIETDPKTALGRGVCKEVGACEYGRVRESSGVDVRAVVSRERDPVSTAARHWLEKYKECLKVIEKFRDHFSIGGRPDEIRAWFLKWLERHPLHEFCWVRDWICEMSDDEIRTETTMVRVLFWLVQDCRNALIGCACVDCEDTGVPLARVWLQSRERHGRKECVVLGVDAALPYRRPISSDCWPAPLGYVNVAQGLWKRPGEACTTLATVGITMREEPFALPRSVRELYNRLNHGTLAACDSTAYAQVFDAGLLGKRVVGFRSPGHERGLGPIRGNDRDETNHDQDQDQDRDRDQDQDQDLPEEDDLTTIKDIGRGRARICNEHDIYTYQQIVEAGYEKLQKIFPSVDEAAIRRWIAEARASAKGATEWP
jgi:predicted flap endonuclease-1-like 5' DNA nuclease